MIRTPLSSSSTLSPLAPPFTVDRLQPYRYPLSTPSVAELNGDAAFDGDGSKNSLSWIDPSLPYNVTPFNKGAAAQSSVACGDAYSSWYGKHIDSSAGQLHSGADSSAKQDENPAMCMKKDPTVYYPATCSSTTPRNGFSASQHGNLLYSINDNYVDYMLHNKKTLGINQYSNRKEGNAKESVKDSKMEGNNMTWNSWKATTCSSLENEAKSENSMDYSGELKYGFKAKQLKFTDPVTSSSKSNSSLQTSSDITDQPNLSVDSPCWKGASTSQKYSFSCGEMSDHHHVVKESTGFDDLVQGWKFLPVTAHYLRTSPYQEKDDSLVFQGNKKFSSPILGDLSPFISLCGTDEQLHDANAKGSGCAEAVEEKSCHISCAISEKSNEINTSENDSAQVMRNVKQAAQERSAILSSTHPGSVLEGDGSQPEAISNYANVNRLSDRKLVADDLLRKFSMPGVLGQVAKPINSTDVTSGYPMAGNDIRLIVKAMHVLSEVLLSSLSYKDVLDWTECDHELVQLVIGNLETFTIRSKKGNELGRSQVPVSKSLDAVKKQSNTSCQVLVEDLESYVFDKRVNNPQAAVLYKNLWMQAEAAVCSMKYELQLACRKHEMENNLEHETKAKEPVQVIKSLRLNSVQCLDPPVLMTPPSLCNSACHPMETDAGKTSVVKTKGQKAIKDH